MLQSSLSLDDLNLFFLVHSAGGISAASREFDLSKASLSRAIARLEKTAGSPLFDRTGSGLRLTATGNALLGIAQQTTRIASEAENILRAAADTPQGDLTIAASALSAQQLLGPVLSRMHKLYPAVRPKVVVTAAAPDPLVEDLDVVLRLGRPEEPYLVARRIITSPLLLYASKQRSLDTDIDDPEAVEALGRVQIDVPGMPPHWLLHNGQGKHLRMTSQPLAVVGDPTVALGFLRAGSGVALLPSLYGEPRVQSGDFIRVLPAWQGVEVDIFAAFPPRRNSIPAVRAFIDLLVEYARETTANTSP